MSELVIKVMSHEEDRYHKSWHHVHIHCSDLEQAIRYIEREFPEADIPSRYTKMERIQRDQMNYPGKKVVVRDFLDIRMYTKDLLLLKLTWGK